MKNSLYDQVIIIGNASGIKNSLILIIGYQEIKYDTNEFLKIIRKNFEEKFRGHGNIEVLATVFYSNREPIEVYEDFFSRSRSTNEELTSAFQEYQSNLSKEIFFISYDQVINLITKILGSDFSLVEYFKGVEVANNQLAELNKKQNDDFEKRKNNEENISAILKKVQDVELMWVQRYFENQKKITNWKNNNPAKTGFFHTVNVLWGKEPIFNYEEQLINFCKNLEKITNEELPRYISHECKNIPSIKKEIAFFRSDDVEGIALHDKQLNCQMQIQLFIKKMENSGEVYLEGICKKCQFQADFHHKNLKHVQYVFKNL